MGNSSQDLVEAVRLWSGRGIFPMPQRNEGRVLDRFGREQGARFLRQINLLQSAFYSSDAHVVATDMSDMHERSIRDFKSKYPDVDDEIVSTLAWCYTYDYR